MLIMAIVLAATVATTSAPAQAQPGPLDRGDCASPNRNRGAISTLGRLAGQEGRSPHGWRESRSRSFDANADGVADVLSFDRRGAHITWTGGTLHVPGATPDGLILADLTADGVADLVAVSHAHLRISIGPIAEIRGTATGAGNPNERDDSLDLSAIGAGGTGWATPLGPELYVGSLRVRDQWDLDGDGAADLAVQAMLERAAGPVQRFSGRRCGSIVTPASPTPASPTPASNTNHGDAPVGGRAAAIGRPSVTPGIDIADPDVVRVGRDFFVYSTNSNTFFGFLNVPLRLSSNLTDWFLLGDVLPTLGSWADPTVHRVWAPSVKQVGAEWVMLYTAPANATTGGLAGTMCIGRAVAPLPTGPFVDNSGAPFFCQGDLGGSIDAELITDPNGSPRMLVKNNGNSIAAPSRIWSQALTTDAGATVGPAVELMRDDQAWESPTVEAPAMVKNNGVDWLFYSGGQFAGGQYAIGTAACSSNAGPCSKTSIGGPWYGSDAFALGPGGQDTVTDALGGEWMMYHGWYDGKVADEGGVRSLFIQKLSFASGSPQLDPNAPYTDAILQPSGAPGKVGATALPRGATVWWTDITGNVPAASFDVFIVPQSGGQSQMRTVPGQQRTVTFSNLNDGNTYGVFVQARNVGGTGPMSPASLVTTGLAGQRFTPLPSARLLDTRDGTGVVNNAAFPLGPGQTLVLTLANRGGLPAAGGFGAVALNLTVTNAGANLGAESHLRVWPADVGVPPDASMLNFAAGETRAASTTVGVSPDGKVRIYNNAGWTNVIADVVGYFTPQTQTGGGHHTLAPTRVLDTRSAIGVPGTSPLNAGTSIPVTLTAVGGVPAATQVAAVVLNLTVANPSAATHIRAWANTSTTPPSTSVINVGAGQDTANLAIVPVAPDGSIRLFNNSGTAHLIADVVGWYGKPSDPGGASYFPITPARFSDSRGGSALGAGEERIASPSLYGFLGSLVQASAITATLTVDRPTTSTHLTVWPADRSAPAVSMLNAPARRALANAVDVQVAYADQPDPRIGVRNNGGQAHAILDLTGWFGPEA